MKKNVFFVAAIFAALCLNSCDKNDPDNPIAGGSGKILLTTALPNATGMDGTVYMQLIDEPVLGKTMATNNNNGINRSGSLCLPKLLFDNGQKRTD